MLHITVFYRSLDSFKPAKLKLLSPPKIRRLLSPPFIFNFIPIYFYIYLPPYVYIRRAALNLPLPVTRLSQSGGGSSLPPRLVCIWRAGIDCPVTGHSTLSSRRGLDSLSPPYIYIFIYVYVQVSFAALDCMLSVFRQSLAGWVRVFIPAEAATAALLPQRHPTCHCCE